MKIDLRRQRYEVGLTMAEVAKKVGVSEATVSRWESGDIKNMKRDKIVLLANALNISPALLMDWDVPTSGTGDVQEAEITQLCKKLSDTDKNKVIGFINGLLSSETYTKKPAYDFSGMDLSGAAIAAFGGTPQSDPKIDYSALSKTLSEDNKE